MTKYTIDKALEMLEVFSEIGLTLAPANPDEYMCYIGAKMGGVDPETAERVYRFMIDAALDRHLQPETDVIKDRLPPHLR